MRSTFLVTRARHHDAKRNWRFNTETSNKIPSTVLPLEFNQELVVIASEMSGQPVQNITHITKGFVLSILSHILQAVSHFTHLYLSTPHAMRCHLTSPSHLYEPDLYINPSCRRLMSFVERIFFHSLSPFPPVIYGMLLHF
jgi:hypothetical protein